MWPWDHVALGYLLFALVRHGIGWPKPTDRVAAMVVIGTQLPDLVDKPLAWSLGVLSTGTAIGHSIWFLGLIAAVTGVFAVRSAKGALSAALTIGIASHLIGDVLFAIAVGSASTYELVLWPFVTVSSDSSTGMFAAMAVEWDEFVRFLGGPRGRVYLIAEAGMLLAAVGVWIRDGAPGPRLLHQLAKQLWGFSDG